MLDRALAALEAEQRAAGYGDRFDRLRDYLAGGGPEASYSQVATELGMSQSAVKVAVHRLRNRLGALLRLEVSLTVVDEGQVDDEIRHLFEVLRARGEG